jgi:hypothetical protein
MNRRSIIAAELPFHHSDYSLRKAAVESLSRCRNRFIQRYVTSDDFGGYSFSLWGDKHI